MKSQTHDHFTANLIYGIVVAILVIIIGVGLIIFQNLNTKNRQLADQQVAIENQLAVLVNKGEAVHYMVAPNGNLSKNGLTTINTAQNVFSTVTTFTSGAQYTAHRNWSQRYVTDRNFYQTFLRPDQDNTGHSIVDSLNLKSKFNESTTYQLSSNRYLLIGSCYMYHNASDLNQEAKLIPTTSAFIIGGYGHTINYMRQISNITNQNGVQ